MLCWVPFSVACQRNPFRFQELDFCTVIHSGQFRITANWFRTYSSIETDCIYRIFSCVCCYHNSIIYHIHACYCYVFFLLHFSVSLSLCLPPFWITVYCLYNQHFACVSFSIHLIHLLANTISLGTRLHCSSSIRHHQFFSLHIYIIMAESCFPPFVQMSLFITYHFCMCGSFFV